MMRFNKKRARKSKRVSWATGADLCQVKVFGCEDCPSKVGPNSQDHHQAKTSLISHSSDDESIDLPPGFEGNSMSGFPPISQIKWECPPQFSLPYHWQVAAGEASIEKRDQKLREIRVLEAIYPCHSTIPLSPSISLDAEQEDYDDRLTPLIPLIPIEEGESSDNLTSTSHTVSIPDSTLPFAEITPGMVADLAASYAVIAAAMRSNQQGISVDMDLVARIINDPTMMESLVTVNRTAATTESASMGIPSVSLSAPSLDAASSGITPTNTVGFGMRPATQPVSLLNQHATMLVPTMPLLSQLTSTHDNPATLSVPLSRPMPGNPATPSISLYTPPAPPHVHRTYIDVSNGLPPAVIAQPPHHDNRAYGANRGASPFTSSITFNELNSVPLPSANYQVQPAASAMPYQQSTGPAAPIVKDANYYKNLIRQHGADKHDTQNSQQIGIRHSNFQDLKPVPNKPGEGIKHKIQKPCIYFKSYRGCRNGNNCLFQHHMSVQRGGGQDTKRLKL